MLRWILLLFSLMALLLATQCLRSKKTATAHSQGLRYAQVEVDSTWADLPMNTPISLAINDTLTLNVLLQHRSSFMGSVISYRGNVTDAYTGSVAISYQPTQTRVVGTIVIRLGNQFQSFSLAYTGSGKTHQWSKTDASDVLKGDEVYLEK